MAWQLQMMQTWVSGYCIESVFLHVFASCFQAVHKTKTHIEHHWTYSNSSKIKHGACCQSVMFFVEIRQLDFLGRHQEVNFNMISFDRMILQCIVMVRLGPKAMPHLFLRPSPPQPQIKETNSWLSLGSTLTHSYSTSAVSHWFHRESLLSSCSPSRHKIATIFLDSPTTESHFAGETAHSALKQRDTNTHQHGWTAQSNTSLLRKLWENEDSDMKRVEPLASHGIPKSNGLSNVSLHISVDHLTPAPPSHDLL